MGGNAEDFTFRPMRLFRMGWKVFLFHRKYIVALKCESTVVSYEIKNAPRGMRTSRRRGLLLRNTARARRVRKRTLCSNSLFETHLFNQIITLQTHFLQVFFKKVE